MQIKKLVQIRKNFFQFNFFLCLMLQKFFSVSDITKKMSEVDLAGAKDDEIVAQPQTLKWKVNLHVPATKGDLVNMFKGYINRAELMVGPSDYYGTMRTFKKGTFYTVMELDGSPRLVLLKGNPIVYDSKIRSKTRIPKSIVKGHWLSTKKEAGRPSWYARELKKVSGANVFDAEAWGNTFFVMDGDVLRIPLVDGLMYKDVIQQYNGARIIKFGDPLPTSDVARRAGDVEVALMSYTFKPAYRGKVVMKGGDGPGMFIETHNFPHYAFAADEGTKAIITLGRQSIDHDDVYEFTSFTLPYGYVIYLPENTIHTDGLSIGAIAITVIADDKTADTAFLRNVSGGLVSIKSIAASECLLSKNPDGSEDIIFVNRKGAHDTCSHRNKGYYINEKGRKVKLPEKCAANVDEMEPC